MKKIKSCFKYLLLIFLLSFCCQIKAAENRDTLKVLFIGNSYVYYNNLAQMISLMTDSMSTKLICTKSTIGSATLGQHWNELRGLKTRQLLAKNKYDIVVIQDNSMWPIEHRDSVLLYGNLFCNTIRKTSAKTFIFNTWARQKTPETQSIINEVYNKLASDNKATIVPVGDSWALALKNKPSIDLFTSDGSHPSNLGTFLIALNFIKKITGTLPNKYATVYNYLDRDGETFRIMQLSDAEIQFFVGIINEVIKN